MCEKKSMGILLCTVIGDERRILVLILLFEVEFQSAIAARSAVILRQDRIVMDGFNSIQFPLAATLDYTTNGKSLTFLRSVSVKTLFKNSK
jgi:hypothetical protein